MVSVEESAAVARLIKENQALQERLSAQQARTRALASKEAELAVQRRAVDALEKYRDLASRRRRQELAPRPRRARAA